VAQGRSDNGPTFTRKIMESEKDKDDSITREVRLGEVIAKIAQEDEELLKRLSQ
jgi:hypothetical protein